MSKPRRWWSGPTRPAQPRGDLATASASLRILIVDGNRDAADSLAMLLGLWGHCPKVSYAAADALESAASFRPAVLLTDIVLPYMDGLQLAARLREESGSECPFLVAVTGLGQAVFRKRAREAGFDHFLVKPADPYEVHELLNRLAEERDNVALASLSVPPQWPGLFLGVRNSPDSRATRLCRPASPLAPAAL